MTTTKTLLLLRGWTQSVHTATQHQTTTTITNPLITPTTRIPERYHLAATNTNSRALNPAAPTTTLPPLLPPSFSSAALDSRTNPQPRHTCTQPHPAARTPPQSPPPSRCQILLPLLPVTPSPLFLIDDNSKRAATAAGVLFFPRQANPNTTTTSITRRQQLHFGTAAASFRNSSRSPATCNGFSVAMAFSSGCTPAATPRTPLAFFSAHAPHHEHSFSSPTMSLSASYSLARMNTLSGCTRVSLLRVNRRRSRTSKGYGY